MKASQKKLLGWVLIVPLSIIFVVFALITAYTFFSTEEELIDSIYSLIFTMGIMWFPLRYSYKLIKSARPRKQERQSPDLTYPAISLDVNIDFKSYYKLMLITFYRSAVVQYMTFISALMLIGACIQLVKSGETSVMFFLFAFGLLMPLFIYFNARKSYATTKHLQYPTNYTFSDEGISLNSEYVQSKASWATIHKVLELKQWFILYTSTNVGYLIPKKSFVSEEEMQAFKVLVANATEKSMA